MKANDQNNQSGELRLRLQFNTIMLWLCMLEISIVLLWFCVIALNFEDSSSHAQKVLWVFFVLSYSFYAVKKVISNWRLRREMKAEGEECRSSSL